MAPGPLTSISPTTPPLSEGMAFLPTSSSSRAMDHPKCSLPCGLIHGLGLPPYLVFDPWGSPSPQQFYTLSGCSEN